MIKYSREDQTKIHINGYLTTGGSIERLVKSINFLSSIVGRTSSKKANKFLTEILKQRNERMLNLKESSLSDFDKSLVAVISSVAIGNQKLIEASIRIFIKHYPKKTKFLRHVFIHQIVYCGFPAAMNAFAGLKSVQKEDQ